MSLKHTSLAVPLKFRGSLGLGMDALSNDAKETVAQLSECKAFHQR